MKTITSENTESNASCIYVSYFNPFYIVKNQQYIAVQAGKETSKYNLNIKGDNTGNNISAQNFVYSELTVLYWVWKNAPKTKHVGFCHYRRFFDFENKDSFPVTYKGFLEDETSLIETIPAIDFDKLMTDYDLLMPMNIVSTLYGVSPYIIQQSFYYLVSPIPS